MSEVTVRRYATLMAVADELEADEEAFAAAQRHAPDGWRSTVKRLGYQPLADPEVHVDRAAFPTYYEDPETGEEIRLPSTTIRVVGSVIPAGILLPDGFTYDPLQVRYDTPNA